MFVVFGFLIILHTFVLAHVLHDFHHELPACEFTTVDFRVKTEVWNDIHAFDCLFNMLQLQSFKVVRLNIVINVLQSNCGITLRVKDLDCCTLLTGLVLYVVVLVILDNLLLSEKDFLCLIHFEDMAFLLYQSLFFFILFVFFKTGTYHVQILFFVFAFFNKLNFI